MLIKISSRDESYNKHLPTIAVRIGSKIIYCEIPETDKDQKTGLKFREFLPSQRGMLFHTHSRYMPLFTMADVNFDLDGIFVGNDNKIKDIIKMHKLNASTAYTTNQRVPIKYVIEINGGASERNGIKIGDLVYLN